MPVVSEVLGRLRVLAEQLAVFALAFLVVYLIGRLLVLPVVRRIMRVRDVEPTLRKPAARGIHAAVAVLAVAVAFALAGFGNLLTATSTMAAAATLAVGFAARDVLSNVVSGVFMIADPQFNIGDWVRWNDKEGVIEDISFRMTRVRTFDNELISVPNTELATTAVTNVVAKERRRSSVTFGVGYGDDLEEAKAIVRDAALDSRRILEKPHPEVYVSELADSYVGLEALVWTGAGAPTAEVLSNLRQRVKERFDEAGIEMPYPYRQLTGGVEVRGGAGGGAGAGTDRGAGPATPPDSADD